MANTSDSQPILVPVDFSAESKEAVLYALGLSGREKRPLIVLHVVHDNGTNNGAYRARREEQPLLPMHDLAEQEMRDFMKAVRDQYADAAVLDTVEIMVIDGIPVNRILEVARDIEAAHIIVGGNKRGTLSRILNGSVSYSLVKDCRFPVTVIHCQDLDKAQH